MPSIQSVLEQTHNNIEIIVVGDCCTDGTAEIVQGIPDRRVKWHNLAKRSGSQSGPNNKGAGLASSRYVAYLGHDDIWAPHHVELLLRGFNDPGNPDFVVSGAAFHLPPGINKPYVTGLFEHEPDPGFVHFFPPSSFAHKRDVVDRIGCWQPPQSIRAPVDHDFLLRAAQAGCRFASTGYLTVHKFAAGHRYLSYIAQDSTEQIAMLERVRQADHGEYAASLVEQSREVGRFMVHRHGDFEQFEVGQLARENAERKGSQRPKPRALQSGQLIVQEAGQFALDWVGTPDFGGRCKTPIPRY